MSKLYYYKGDVIINGHPYDKVTEYIRAFSAAQALKLIAMRLERKYKAKVYLPNQINLV